MKHVYDPYVLKKFAEGRIFFVNSKMPFEFFVDCFQREQPFFIVSELEDGRLGIIPNTMFIPQNLQGEFGYGPWDLLPTEFEYVTMKNATYPMIVTAHPLPKVEDWLRKFERQVNPFAKQTFWEFVSSHDQFLPIQFDKRRLIKETVM